MKKLFSKGIVLTLMLSTIGGMTAQAQTDGYGQGQGRTDTVNVNDYSTSAYDRFTTNYKFESGTDANKDMGRPTHTSTVPTPNPLTQNVQRNKDASFAPPSYGVFSGDIDTERTNPYFSPANYDKVRNTTDYTQTSAGSGINASDTGGILPSTSLLNENSNIGGNLTSSLTNSNNNQSTNAIPQLPSSPQNTTISYSPQPTSRPNDTQTEAWLYDDGSIGTLKIPRFNAKVKVYEGESLANLAKGLGHFSFSSSWDGNVSICGHNDREFKNLKNLNVGDEIIYETKYGTRTYVMQSRDTISDTDYSTLEYTTANQLTLITCVNGSPTQRYSVVAVEKK